MRLFVLHPRFKPGTRRVSQVLERFSTCVPRSRVDPGRPSRTSPRTIGPSVLASDAVKNVAVCIKRNDGAVSSFGEYGLSCGLHVSLCTLQLTCSVFTSAVAVATLGRSGWLILTPQGLSPCKKRQASLGAPTILALSRERRENHLTISRKRRALLGGLKRRVSPPFSVAANNRAFA